MGAAKGPATTTAEVAELQREATRLGLALSPLELNRFRVYIDTLLLWRTRLSLTAAATGERIVRCHVLDSLALCRFVRDGMRIVDLGSGAGFPGIPLAIACGGARLSLVESRRKKANFLREVLRAARLANAEVIEDRADRLADHGGRRWDLIVSRAVWALSEYLDVSEPLLAAGGLVIAMKGPKATQEARAYHGRLIKTDVVDYELLSGARHRLLLYRKP
jgi:16S rRNA (guanine527-N7)-methyltransferase